MPKKSSAKKTSKVFRSKEEIERILSEVSAAQAGGSPRMATLKKLNIPYNSYIKWVKRSGKSAEAPVPIAEKATAKAVASKKAKPGRGRYTPEQKDEMRRRDEKLKAEGKSDKAIAKILRIARPTLYRLRKSAKPAAKKSQGRVVAKGHIQLSPDNPMYELAVAHQQLKLLNSHIDRLMAERDVLTLEMKQMMERAASICPGLKRKK